MILDYIGTIVPGLCTIQKELETRLDIFPNDNKAGSFDYGQWI